MSTLNRFTHTRLGSTSSTLSEASDSEEYSGDSEETHSCHVCQCRLSIDESLAELNAEETDLFGSVTSLTGIAMALFRTQSEEIPYVISLRDLFHSCSLQSDKHHPYCYECAKLLLLSDKQRLRNFHFEVGEYSKTREKLQQPYSTEGMDEEILELQQMERELKAKSDTLAKQIEEQQRVFSTQQLEQSEIELLLHRFWEFCGHHEEEKTAFFAEYERQTSWHIELKILFDRLRWSNVYNEALYISLESHFGVINGMRLGSLPVEPVPWEENNCAWGYTTQLLFLLSKRLRFKFTKYRLLPRGSFSSMERLGVSIDARKDPVTLPLFATKDSNNEEKKNYDLAQVAFLQCLAELAQYSRSLERTLKLPYRIVGGTVGDISIKRFATSGGEENSTHASRLMLIDMKTLLSWSDRYLYQHPKTRQAK